jgi:RNA polymerase sigma-70 factor (ECF subfamily)
MGIIMNEKLTDEQLIKKFQNGDRQSYNELVYRYKDKILNFIFRFTYDRVAAEDLAQDTFLKLYQKKDSYKEISKFSTWLYTIASNLAKTELRKIKRRKTYSISNLSNSEMEDIIFTDFTNNEDKIDKSENHLLNISIQELEPDFRIIIILREIQELSYDNISRILELPLGTVKSRINRGKLKLREILINKGVNRK